MTKPSLCLSGYWPFPALLGHRGGGTLAPENTLAGLRLALSMGYQGVEVDVKLTRDGVPILMHDDTMERTSNGHGPVAILTLADLAALEAGSWFGPRFTGEPIPTLEAMAALCLEGKLWANLEIKPCPGRDEETGSSVARAAARLWQGSRTPPLLSSFSVAALQAAQSAAPGLARGLLVSDISEQVLSLAAGLGCASIHCHYRGVTPALVAGVHEAGFALLCYTVNDPVIGSRLALAGVDCVVTDRLDLFPSA